eukprot:CAMPEP_0182446882 /NCGR_PEP_ID=MMETSP1172-20130603/8021_1 /TAXON_ID=708627 /ORGANISM="Timspurckia oligopyrenoides, Strain CCMP3278" /LENGTH=316 /DNA_ID=CAMNT_0024643039 /DNA_START=52 /DNA_END=999 /DNA_ORIENTATION=-
MAKISGGVVKKSKKRAAGKNVHPVVADTAGSGSGDEKFNGADVTEKDVEAKNNHVSAGFLKNKTNVLLFCTRGITSRNRHLMEDLRKLMPHAKKEPKLDSKDRLSVANEVAELRNCDTVVLFEARKRQDLFIWISKSPLGPSIKFNVVNIHTMDELKFPGNNLLYSRAVLSFDPLFDSSEELRLMKELLSQAFSVPEGHRKSKPFYDHMISFFYLDSRVWFRHYQILEKADIKNSEESQLVEIGPRFVMTPIRIFSGSFSGATLWENQQYISPNELRRAAKASQQTSYRKRVHDKAEKQARVSKLVKSDHPLDTMF